ncbi:MAG TPA: response regulator transcription factor [Anaerolineae bacterium]|nr:response regulator transcription factor [Anaerolineae bacterium]
MARRIVIVDDEEVITRALDILLTQASYEVAIARSGPEALALLSSSRSDLVILDIMLPEMDGYEVCRCIRQLPEYIPIIMLTARDEPLDKLLGLELGADLYLTKPFEPRELLAHIKAIFRLLEHRSRAGTAGEIPLVCGPLALWDAQHRVELAGRMVDLTPKEYELLRLFMRHPGRAFGRETLLRQAWGYDYPGDSRTVDVHVQRLRAKIEADPAQPRFLRTVRGFGYRLIAPLEIEETT